MKALLSCAWRAKENAWRVVVTVVTCHATQEAALIG